MNGSVVERFAAAGNAHEAGGLLKGLRTELRHLQQIAARAETAVGFAIGDNISGNCFADTGDVLQQRGGGGIQINTDPVYTVLDDAGKRLAELLLVHIVLILTDADGLRVDLHELCQRILYAASHGSRTALLHIEIRKFLGTECACGIDGGAGLIRDDVLHLLRYLFQDIHDHLLRFAGSGSVAE